MSVTSTLIGLIIITRHADRQGFYQAPTTYTATDTAITPLGEVQEYQSGLGLQRRYLNASAGASSTDLLQGFSWPVPSLPQLSVEADSSEGQVIVDSALAFFQGFFPPTSYSNTTLANGTTIYSPLGGYTYIPVTTVAASEDFSLEGYTNCPAFTTHTADVYASDAFVAKGNDAASFLASLEPIVDGRNTSFQNAYNIFDYMNVNYIHNKTFMESVTTEQMSTIRSLADYHEHAVFTDASPSGVGNMAGKSLLGPVLDSLADIVNTTTERKLSYIGVAYKPIMSLLNLTESTQESTVPDYASALALEIRNSSSGDLSVQMKFRSGPPTETDGSDLASIQMFGQDSMSVSEFQAKLSPYAVTTRTEWCDICKSTSEECNLFDLSNGTSSYASSTSTTGRHHVSPVVAGVIGALVSLAVAAAAFAAFESFRNKRRPTRAAGTGGGSTHELSRRQSDYEPDSKAASLNAH